ncbi:glycosyltransferase [Psychroserpens burtonensis]|uniref:Glycosyltransferase n=1 Tax=Psychroserpens burtonensis TaxID=49278 RepID=A0A5C7BDE9_9FLAO|nr:glycosyltransferase [Psychroserpens burtonensis]TXE17130.1 glycosyltransferase [Psychroserpens burtonensis]
MKILIVNTYDRGGAANACLRLHEGLLLKNVDTNVLLRRKEKNIPQTFQFHNTHKPKSKLQVLKEKSVVFLRIMGVLQKPKQSLKSRFLTQRQEGLELFTFPHSNFDVTTSPLYQEADIINLHWVANFLDYESFFRKNTKPVVWTLHDMNPFTGGQHYLETFLGVDESGNPIKRVLAEEETRVSNANLMIKENSIKSTSNITVVTPSKWLCQAAKESDMFSAKKIYHIPYGLDSKVFQPRDRDYSRDILNIPKNKKVILFVADSISNHRKGYAYLKKALDMIKLDDVVLCAVGGKTSELESEKSAIELGLIYDERLMSIVYSAADVFVIPSLMDNLPNTVLESLMCGTPVIGFSVGGIPDMIEHNINGLLVDNISSQSLVKTIKQFFATIDNFNRSSIRTTAVKKYDLAVQANAYTKLFEDILK